VLALPALTDCHQQGSFKPYESPVVSDTASHQLVKEEPGANLFCYNSPPPSATIMSPSSLLPKDTPNVKFRMELASQIQDSPSSLAHLDANLMLNIGDTPNDKIRYAYRFGDDFGCGISPASPQLFFISSSLFNSFDFSFLAQRS
jgi:hypothetical protein